MGVGLGVSLGAGDGDGVAVPVGAGVPVAVGAEVGSGVPVPVGISVGEAVSATTLTRDAVTAAIVIVGKRVNVAVGPCRRTAKVYTGVDCVQADRAMMMAAIAIRPVSPRRFAMVLSSILTECQASTWEGASRHRCLVCS